MRGESPPQETPVKRRKNELKEQTLKEETKTKRLEETKEISLKTTGPVFQSVSRRAVPDLDLLKPNVDVSLLFAKSEAPHPKAEEEEKEERSGPWYENLVALIELVKDGPWWTH